MLVLSFFGFGLQALADASRGDDGFSVGEPYAVSPTVSFAPVPGWVRDPDRSLEDVSVAMTKNGWDFTVSAAFELVDDETLEDFADDLRMVDSDSTVQYGDISTFVTTSGLHGLTWKSHDVGSASVTWLIENGGVSFTRAFGRGPDSSLNVVEPELTTMMASLTTTDGGTP